MSVPQVIITNSGNSELTANIQNLSHKMNEKKDNELTLTMYDKNYLVDSLSKGDIFTFRYGWQNGLLTRVRKCKVMRIGISPISKESVRINITATDLGFSQKYQKSDQIYKNKTATQIVTAIANKYKFAKKTIDNTTKVYEEIIQNNKSDFEICQMLAKREHLKFYVDDDEFIFTKENYDLPSQRTYTWDDDELITWSISDKNDKASAGVQKQVVQNIDPDTGELVKTEVDNETQENKKKLNKETPKYVLGLGETGAEVITEDIEEGEVKETTNTVTGADKAEVSNQANLLKEKNDKSPIELSATLRGNPTLLVGDVITFKFEFVQYSGNYKITAITNTLDANSSFTTKLTCTTNAVRKGEAPVPANDVNKTEGETANEEKPKLITGRAFDGSEVKTS